MTKRSGTAIRRALPVLAAMLFAASSSSAEEPGELSFDIYRTDSNLVAWIDFSTLLTSQRVDGLKEGVDLEVTYRVRLTQPRRLWGERSIASESGRFELDYRLVTNRYELSLPDPPDSGTHSFSSLARLHRFLADSILIPVAESDLLDGRARYRLTADETCISLTTFNLSDEDAPPSASSSPLRYLFSTFLDLAGYGRTDFQAHSEPFSVSDLPTKE